MKKNEKKIKVIELSTLKYNKNNPSIVIDSKFHKLVNSIKEFSKMMQIREIVVDENNISLGGNKRLKAINTLVDLVKSDENVFSNDKALRELLLKGKIPATWVKKIEGLSDKEKREFVIKDNINFGEWDWELLINEDSEWDANDLDDWGLDIPDFVDEVEIDIQEDEYQETENLKIYVDEGDLIEFICDDGRIHRLLCGDSTCIDSINKLMNGKKADMVFTDPPYGMFLDTDYSKIKGSKKSIGFNSSKSGNKYDKIIGDNEDFSNELINTIFASFDYCNEVFIWGADYFVNMLPNYGKDGSWLVWNKRTSKEQQKAIGNCFELCWSKSKHKRYVFDFEWFGFLSKKDPKEARNRLHPSMKPSKLFCEFVEKFCKKSNLIADIYIGSGTTMVGAHQIKKTCYGVELDPKYCQVIIDRMKKLDSSIVVKINGIEYDKTV